VYIRSFADTNADGVGDLDGIISRLGYLELLGVDALWITPCFRSPMADHGYDVADPRDIDPVFGDLDTFDRLVAASHEHGIRVILDLVPNHTSETHEWFQAALGAAPGSPERGRYHFRYGRGDDGSEPPNNWPSIFGGSAWSRITEPHGQLGQWYLHLFAPEQPDLNWENPEVWADLEQTLRFWLDRGVDGFRIDVAHGLAKPEGLPDGGPDSFGLQAAADLAITPDTDVAADPDTDGRKPDLRFDHDAVHEVHRKIRSVVDEYRDRVLIGEIWVSDDARFGDYLRPDEMHLGFNFRLTGARFDAAGVRSAIEHSMESVAKVGAPPTWTLANHDVPRPVTRFGNGEQGTARARAMALVELGLPGVVFVYNGDELGLPSAELADESLRDPVWERSGRTRRGRDGHRIPVPWEGTEPPFGFSDADKTWLPIPAGWAGLTVETQLEDPDSTLSLYRHALELRRTHPGFGGDVLEWYGAPEGCLAYRRQGSTLVCALNTSGEAVPLPPGEVLLSSGPLTEDGQLPPDTAAWLA
jgi:alpha-glucosidase